VAAFGPELVKAGLQAGKFVGSVAKRCGGGGGRPHLAQAGGRDPAALEAALVAARAELLAALSA
jgi:alanyl-tRNA synthetase